jgi:hypothetical protein
MGGPDAIIGAIELRDSGQGQVSARATCSVEIDPSVHAVLSLTLVSGIEEILRAGNDSLGSVFRG